jgi:hypothetical protein
MRHWLYLLALVALFAAGGASCPPRRAAGPLAPVVFAAPPTLENAVAAVNASSASIRTLQADNASLSTAGLPAMRTNLVVERPRRFRMRAEVTALTGPELDLGSNEDLFWMWVKRNRPPAVYYARHDQFQRSAARQMLPIEPEWLIEALGLVYLDPSQQHEGPIARPDGNLEIRSRIPTAGGEMGKVLVIDRQFAWVLEQHVYDTSGQLIASVRASRHRWYPNERVSLPGRIEIGVPAAQMSFQLDVGGYAINQLSGDPAQLWSVPQIEGYPLVDIADPSFRVPGMEENAQPATFAPGFSRTSYQPKYRGYNQ